MCWYLLCVYVTWLCGSDSFGLCSLSWIAWESWSNVLLQGSYLIVRSWVDHMFDFLSDFRLHTTLCIVWKTRIWPLTFAQNTRIWLLAAEVGLGPFTSWTGPVTYGWTGPVMYGWAGSIMYGWTGLVTYGWVCGACYVWLGRARCVSWMVPMNSWVGPVMYDICLWIRVLVARC